MRRALRCSSSQWNNHSSSSRLALGAKPFAIIRDRCENCGLNRQRLVSRQRLIHHRDNWYLDAWDPKQSALRRFALDRIHKPELTDQTAIDIPSTELDTHQEAGYGIFAGPISATAVIHTS